MEDKERVEVLKGASALYYGFTVPAGIVNMVMKRPAIEPEHWTVRFIAPRYLVDADYWKGGTFVHVERREQGVIGVLEAMHRSQGANVGWILLADSIAGSLIVLSLTGVILWTELNRKRAIGATIFIVSLIAMIVLAADSPRFELRCSRPPSRSVRGNIRRDTLAPRVLEAGRPQRSRPCAAPQPQTAGKEAPRNASCSLPASRFTPVTDCVPRSLPGASTGNKVVRGSRR
ncbi:putative PepSY-like transmembrane protein [Paraburkholderia rhizosphaerae]|uniref:Putative PepSY-like transmembrane protein n=2 Tax=Paraburkholderia rhizosphaerae TaxID=480658 RepID=A0A4R8LIU1_9BURK|nr:putative PepSY-like transmembrane protein [Paraburkholderia rhizosphaerae]